MIMGTTGHRHEGILTQQFRLALTSAYRDVSEGLIGGIVSAFQSVTVSALLLEALAEDYAVLQGIRCLNVQIHQAKVLLRHVQARYYIASASGPAQAAAYRRDTLAKMSGVSRRYFKQAESHGKKSKGKRR